MTLNWSSALSLFWKAKRGRDTRASVYSKPPRFGIKLRHTERLFLEREQWPTALRTGSDGRQGEAVRSRPVRASHSRSRTAGRERHATEHRASCASAQTATRRSLPGHRTQPDQIGPCRLQLQMQPQRALGSFNPPRNRHKFIILQGYSAQFWKSIQLLQQYLPAAEVTGRNGGLIASRVRVPKAKAGCRSSSSALDRHLNNV